MHPLMIAALLQLFFLAAVLHQGERRLTGGAYLPVGLAMLSIIFAAMTLAIPG